MSYNSLAESLEICFDQTGEESLLVEAIDLNREALSLHPTGHPKRSMSCTILAASLCSRFMQVGGESLLFEAIDLQREALSLHPAGHPERSTSCNNLAVSLWACFNQTGDESLLVEAIDLNRESLALCPPGHPERCWSCLNLAQSQWTRLRQTGEESLLVEIIDLQREALSLRPPGHPYRSTACNNLALALERQFDQTGKELPLFEAIDLHREALSLRPAGHADRCYSCSNLAQSLWTLFNQTKEESLLVETINLYREALSLCVAGHPVHFKTCSHLAHLLWTRFVQTRDISLLSEAIILNNKAIASQPEYHPRRWMPITNLIRIYLDPRSSEQDIISGLNYVREAVSINSDNWPALLSSVADLTGMVDLRVLTPDSRALILQCFSAAFDLASRVAGFLLDPESQLTYLENSQHLELGPRAYWCAIESGQPRLGLELIERARAMMWTQALHVQSPQLGRAPPELAAELERLLRRMNFSKALKTPVSTASLALPSMEQDGRYRDNMRINQLIEQIRDIPGHEGFMRGLPFQELAQCACRSLVVILIATEGECHALILQPDDQAPLALKLSDIEPDELITMSIITSAQVRGSQASNVHDHRMGMNLLSSKTRNSPLAKLWTAVVKPIVLSLRLQVRVFSQCTVHRVRKTNT
jgi:hypothetical protein